MVWSTVVTSDAACVLEWASVLCIYRDGSWPLLVACCAVTCCCYASQRLVGVAAGYAAFDDAVLCWEVCVWDNAAVSTASLPLYSTRGTHADGRRSRSHLLSDSRVWSYRESELDAPVLVSLNGTCLSLYLCLWLVCGGDAVVPTHYHGLTPCVAQRRRTQHRCCQRRCRLPATTACWCGDPCGSLCLCVDAAAATASRSPAACSRASTPLPPPTTVDSLACCTCRRCR
jgi:hypothetical protein